MKKTRTLIACSAITLALTTLSGCMTQRAPTPEERAMAMQMQQAFLQRMQNGMQQPAPGNFQGFAANAPAAAAPVETLTEEALAGKLNAFSGTSIAVDIRRARDGLKFGNQVFLDPEGEVINFASNSLTGDVTYFIKLAGGDLAVKYTRAGFNAEPVMLARARQQNGIWSLQTSTGKSLTGERLIPASRGFMVTRDASAFHYAPGQGVKNVSAIDGYHIAQFQNGDVASTGFILLEKDENEDTHDLNQLVDLASSLKKTVGLQAHDDYVLMNMATGTTVAFDKGSYAKNVAVGGTNCKMQSETLRVAKCDTVDFRESLYEPNGSRNSEHYFWSLFWFNTPEGAFAVAKESGTRKVTITELSTGNKAVLFERTLGIADFEAHQTPDGKIQVEAQVGFSREAVNDAVAIFKGASLHAGR